MSWPALAEGEASATDNTAPQQQFLSQGELDALVAPIALYPDALLAQVLMASTFPLEIVQADRWAKANKLLKGDKLDKALAKQDGVNLFQSERPSNDQEHNMPVV